MTFANSLNGVIHGGVIDDGCAPVRHANLQSQSRARF